MIENSQNYPDAHALKRGVKAQEVDPNRFSGFHIARETAEAVTPPRWRTITSLKRGVNKSSSAESHGFYGTTSLHALACFVS